MHDSLVLSLMASEGLHGRTRVQLEANFHLDRDERTCTVQAETEVGRDLVRIFTALLTRQFGEEGFTIESNESRQHA
ncbi:MAG TPA: hypothetical protein VJQ57_09220 [Acidimicrobiia bacterium]|nr:hypothetical protein [Acidimicrobiia bacterium]